MRAQMYAMDTMGQGSKERNPSERVGYNTMTYSHYYNKKNTCMSLRFEQGSVMKRYWDRWAFTDEE